MNHKNVPAALGLVLLALAPTAWADADAMRRDVAYLASDDLAGRLTGTDGAAVSEEAPPSGVAMSVWISACDNARLYTRTSSINPLKYSPYG